MCLLAGVVDQHQPWIQVNPGNFFFFLLVFITNSNKPVVGLFSHQVSINKYDANKSLKKNDAKKSIFKKAAQPDDKDFFSNKVGEKSSALIKSVLEYSKHAKWGVTHSILSKDDGKHDSPGRTQSVKSHVSTALPTHKTCCWAVAAWHKQCTPLAQAIEAWHETGHDATIIKRLCPSDYTPRIYADIVYF